jgi:hypothetical protein
MSWVASGLAGFGLFVGLSLLSTGEMLTWGLLAGFVFVVGGASLGHPRWWRHTLSWGLLLVAAAFLYAVAR